MLTGEIEGLRHRGIDVSGLRISANAHLIMPYHVMLDTAGELKLGKLEIGTTRRGIGPCYADKAARLGIRVQDLLDPKILRKKIMAALEPKQQMLRPYAKDPELDLHTMVEAYLTLRPSAGAAHRRHRQALLGGARRRPHRALRGRPGHHARPRPRHLSLRHLLEPGGRAQPASAPESGPRDIDEVWGIAKAYATRVGAGPFPTELEDDLGELIRERGGEMGTTTGRPRRCGWLDLVALRYAVRLNSMSALAVTKLDVLSGIDPLRVCVRYRHPEGAVFDEFPYHQSIIHTAEPEYEELPGFEGEIGDCRREQDLPAEARDYLAAISDHLQIAGPARRRRPRPRPGDLDGPRGRAAAPRRRVGRRA